MHLPRVFVVRSRLGRATILASLMVALSACRSTPPPPDLAEARRGVLEALQLHGDAQDRGRGVTIRRGQIDLPDVEPPAWAPDALLITRHSRQADDGTLADEILMLRAYAEGAETDCLDRGGDGLWDEVEDRIGLADRLAVSADEPPAERRAHACDLLLVAAFRALQDGVPLVPFA